MLFYTFCIIILNPKLFFVPKACLDEGLDVVCYERTSAIGGLWHYRPDEDVKNIILKIKICVNFLINFYAHSYNKNFFNFYFLRSVQP